MADIDREKIRELLAAATPTPWDVGYTPGYLAGSQRADGSHRREDPLTLRSPAHTEEIATVWTYLLPTSANAELISVAVNNVGPLLDALDAAEKEKEALVALLKRWRSHPFFDSEVLALEWDTDKLLASGGSDVV